MRVPWSSAALSLELAITTVRLHESVAGLEIADGVMIADLHFKRLPGDHHDGLGFLTCWDRWSGKRAEMRTKVPAAMDAPASSLVIGMDVILLKSWLGLGSAGGGPHVRPSRLLRMKHNPLNSKAEIDIAAWQQWRPAQRALAARQDAFR